jgi:hypothetical protein
MRQLILLIALAASGAAAENAKPALADFAKDGYQTLLTPTTESSDGLLKAADAALQSPTLTAADTQNLTMLIDQLIPLYLTTYNDRLRLAQEAKDRQKATDELIAQKDKQIEDLNKQVKDRQDELRRELARQADLEAQLQKEREARAAGK